MAVPAWPRAAAKSSFSVTWRGSWRIHCPNLSATMSTRRSHSMARCWASSVRSCSDRPPSISSGAKATAVSFGDKRGGNTGGISPPALPASIPFTDSLMGFIVGLSFEVGLPRLNQVRQFPGDLHVVADNGSVPFRQPFGCVAGKVEPAERRDLLLGVPSVGEVFGDSVCLDPPFGVRHRVGGAVGGKVGVGCPPIADERLSSGGSLFLGGGFWLWGFGWPAIVGRFAQRDF